MQTSPAFSNAAENLIIALDVDNVADANRVVGQLTGRVGAFKIGLQLFTAAGPSFVRKLCSQGHRIFLDLKFHDIPNTVAMAAIEATRMGVWMFNVHALGGGEMMRRATNEVRDYCDKAGTDRPLMIAVTVLTSTAADALAETGIQDSAERQVLRLARLAGECGMDGVVASAMEAAPIRESIRNSGFKIVTPGIRPDFATKDDQKRVTTPREALAAGADFLVIGRPILAAADRAAAVEQICEEIEAGRND